MLFRFKNTAIKRSILIIILYLLMSVNSGKYAQNGGENYPHNIKTNQKNCLYCHNKRPIPEDSVRLKRITYTHRFDLSEEDCSECHEYNESTSVVPRFKKSIFDLCIKSCHEKRALSLNHPLDVTPSYMVSDVLPLENGQVTCATCHDPHSSGTKTVKEIFGEKEKKTYYLRIENSEGELCRVCHVEYPIF